MAGRLTQTSIDNSPHDRRIRRSWWFLAGSFFVLGLVTIFHLAVGQSGRIDWILAGLVVVVGLAVVTHRDAVAALEEGRRSEAESFARILQGLSRSVSPDAIVDAIVEDLGAGTGADHIVVVRLRPGTEILEATLVSQRPGVPSTRTVLPALDAGNAPFAGATHGGVRGGVDGSDDRAGHGADAGRGSTLGERLPSGMPVRAGEPELVPVAAGWVGADRGGAPASARSRRVASTGVGVGSRTATVETAHVPMATRTAHDGPARGRRATDRTDRPDRRRTWSALGAVASLRAMTARGPERADSVPRPARGGPAGRVADRIASRVQTVYGLKHTIAAPLVTGSGVVGAIVLSRRTADPWPAAAQRILGGAALEASAALERVYSHRAAEARAATDVLTGLPNRRYFEEFCGLLARRRRADDAIGVLMIDIDRFKSLNDDHGHALGDRVLRMVADAIAGAVRDDDVPARYGGEEFAVLLRNPTAQVALEIGERVRRAAALLDLRSLGVDGVTVSVGVAVSDAPDQPIRALIERADRALYAAKGAGRNRVIAV
ncbi:MAG TPA: GGDEF domain-containing protein [Candidatus Limnocylindria bacterium]|nr:GGDEF domain-containing protein [Candidatus Limnocylindria bacterium]